ncbi:hypothetical protein [Psychrobacter piscatorii]|uniref:defense against restriction DarA-related protein n=1 Tax=Psychrobacter piscatorii TaxID=554343 RepID=UPI003734ECCC
MAYTTQNKAHSNHYITKPDGSTASRYSRYEVGRITGRYRDMLAVLADSTGFDSLGFDSSVGSDDDSWHVVNVFDSVNNYIDSMAIGGAMDSAHALQIAKSQLEGVRGATYQLVTNNAIQFDSMDHDHAWSIDAINKLMDNPSQNKSYLPVITAPELVVEAERVTFDSVQWDSNSNLISHGGKDSRLYLDLTRADTRHELVTEFDLADALFDMDAEEAGFDALMTEKHRLHTLKDRLFQAMVQAGDKPPAMRKKGDTTPAEKDTGFYVTNVTQTKEFKRQGVINIAFVFDLSDGQKLSIWFHKPLESSSKLLPSDYMVSWKWMLNKRDVTAALSPKHGDNVQLPALARRIMRLAAKNSKRFKAAQARAAKVEQELLDAEQMVADRKSTISMLDIDIMDLNKKIDMALQSRKNEAEKAPELEKPKGGAFSEGDAVIWMGEYGEISRGTFKNYSPDGTMGTFIDEGGQMRAPVSQLIFNPDVQLTDEQIAAQSEANKYNEMEAIISSLSKSSKRFKEWNMTIESVQALPKEQFFRLADALAAAKMSAYEQLLIAYRVGKQDLIGIAQSIMDNEKSAGETTPEIAKRRERLAQILNTELTLVGSKKDDNSDEDATVFITGQEIDVSEGVDFKTAKNNAMAYFDENLKDKVVFCRAIDSDVVLKRRGGKHIAKANHTFRDKLQLVAAIPEMIKKGKYKSYTEAYKNKSTNIYGYYVLYVLVDVEGVAKNARVVLEKTDKGEALYDIGINKKEALAALGDAYSNKGFDQPTDPSQYQGLDKSYQDDHENVNQFDKLSTNDAAASDLVLNIFFDEDLDLASDTTTDDKVTKGSVNESTTVKGTKISSNFALVEAKKLIVSHDAAGVANPDFPQALQPRDRSDKKSVEAIKANAKKLQPEKLGQTDRVGNGAPIVGDDLVVESGNGRAMAVKLAYDSGDAENYRAWLVENANEFGFSAEQVENYKQPVLVRVRTTAIDRMDFAIEANQDGYPQYFDNEESGDGVEKTVSVYVNSRGRVLATVTEQAGKYHVKGENFSGGNYPDDASVLKQLEVVKASNPSMKLKEGKEFFSADDTGKSYPPVERDQDGNYIAYMDNTKKDHWSAAMQSDGSFIVYPDNAQTRAYRNSKPKFFDGVADLLATYPAFKSIEKLIAEDLKAEADYDEYDEIDSSEYPQMFLDRNKDKLNILGIGDDDIHVGLEDDYENKSDYNDLYHIDSGLFARQTLNFADAVCKTVDAAISLGADAVVGDFTATAYQNSMFDGLDSKSNPTYGITVQIEKGGVYLRAEINAYGECKILKGASGTDVITTIKHVFTDNTNEYQSALADALDIQVDEDMTTTDTHDIPDATLPVEPAESALAKRINEIEQQMSTADFDPTAVDTDELIDLVDQVEDDAELTAKLEAISVTLQQKTIAISLRALTDMAGA